MDPDEGIRILGALKGFLEGGFIFINRSTTNYVINFCDRVHDKNSGLYLPGGKEEFSYYSTSEAVWNMLRTKIVKPLNAWIY